MQENNKEQQWSIICSGTYYFSTGNCLNFPIKYFPTNHPWFANVLLGIMYEYIKSFVWITRISFLIDANLQRTYIHTPLRFWIYVNYMRTHNNKSHISRDITVGMENRILFLLWRLAPQHNTLFLYIIIRDLLL